MCKTKTKKSALKLWFTQGEKESAFVYAFVDHKFSIIARANKKYQILFFCRHKIFKKKNFKSNNLNNLWIKFKIKMFVFLNLVRKTKSIRKKTTNIWKKKQLKRQKYTYLFEILDECSFFFSMSLKCLKTYIIVRFFWAFMISGVITVWFQVWLDVCDSVREFSLLFFFIF